MVAYTHTLTFHVNLWQLVELDCQSGSRLAPELTEIKLSVCHSTQHQPVVSLSGEDPQSLHTLRTKA